MWTERTKRYGAKSKEKEKKIKEKYKRRPSEKTVCAQIFIFILKHNLKHYKLFLEVE